MSHRIRKVAVLGAGTMGAAIAAHCANAGLEVDLLDIAPDDDNKNAVVEAGFDRMKNARPAAERSCRSEDCCVAMSDHSSSSRRSRSPIRNPTPTEMSSALPGFDRT